MDGGTVWNTNLFSAIQRCREQVDNDSQITVDILTCEKGETMEEWDDRGKTESNYLRNQEIK
jgi:hypothetical protein